MKKFFVISMTLIMLILVLPVQSQAQDRVRSVNVGGTPLVPDNLVNGPVPRLPDGKPDLTGPWMGGGSNADIEREGGLKPGELPLLPWAKELRDKRKEEDEPYTACLPMSVPRVNPYPWKFAMSYTSKGLTYIYILHETGDAGAHRVSTWMAASIRTIFFRLGGATRLGRGRATRSSSTPLAITTSSGSIVAAPRTPGNSTRSNDGPGSTMERSSTISRLMILVPFRNRFI